MRILGIVVLVVVALAAIVVVIGWRLPVSHQASRSVTLRASPDVVFALITRTAEFPQWRSDVTRIEPVADEDGHRRYREVGRNGSILFRVDSTVPNERLVTRIADKSLPFGGTWTYELASSGEETTLRITEDGEVYNPVFRFVSRYIMGHTATIDRYLADVERRITAGR